MGDEEGFLRVVIRIKGCENQSKECLGVRVSDCNELFTLAVFLSLLLHHVESLWILHLILECLLLLLPPLRPLLILPNITEEKLHFGIGTAIFVFLKFSFFLVNTHLTITIIFLFFIYLNQDLWQILKFHFLFFVSSYNLTFRYEENSHSLHL
jgi:hypothetical protein